MHRYLPLPMAPMVLQPRRLPQLDAAVAKHALSIGGDESADRYGYDVSNCSIESAAAFGLIALSNPGIKDLG